MSQTDRSRGKLGSNETFEPVPSSLGHESENLNAEFISLTKEVHRMVDRIRREKAILLMLKSRLPYMDGSALELAEKKIATIEHIIGYKEAMIDRINATLRCPNKQ